MIELPLAVGAVGSHPGDCEVPNATFVTTSAAFTGAEKLMVNLTAGPVKQPGAVPVAVVLVTGPSVALCPAPSGTVRLPAVGDVDCTGLGATVCNFVGPGGGAEIVAAGAVTEAFAGVGLVVGFAAVVAPVVGVAEASAAATAADAIALAATEAGGVEAATAGDETGAEGTALDAAATAGLDDAALL